jgi:drug/metabolite transporter (DMT)-like permease
VRYDQAMGWRVQFLLLSATWGSSFLFIKVLDRHWPALWVAFGRVVLGAATLLVLSAVRRERLNFERRTWLHLLVTAVLFNAVPFVLFAFGEKHVASIVAGLWNATAPLWVVAFALLAFPEEHPSTARVAGLVVGFGGVAVLLGPWRGLGGSELTGQLACAGAGVCYGLAWLYTRRHLAGSSASGIALSTGQLLCATALLGVTVPFAAPPTVHIGVDGLASLLTLGVLGTGVAYLFNYSIIRAAGATTAATVTYVVPLFSTLLGVTVLSEPVSWNQPIGAAILLLGIALSQGTISRARAAVAGGSGSPLRSRLRGRTRQGSAG